MASQSNREWMQAMQDKRRSSATTPVRSRTTYNRKRKHSGRGWDE